MTGERSDGLTADEIAAAQRLQVWTVWYEDLFEQFSEEPSSAHVSAVFLSREAADQYAAARGGPPDSPRNKFDGFTVNGPVPLASVIGPDITVERIRQLLGGSDEFRSHLGVHGTGVPQQPPVSGWAAARAVGCGLLLLGSVLGGIAAAVWLVISLLRALF